MQFTLEPDTRRGCKATNRACFDMKLDLLSRILFTERSNNRTLLQTYTMHVWSLYIDHAHMPTAQV